MQYSQVVRKAQRRFRFAIANRMFLYALAGELFIIGAAIAVLRLYYPVAFSSHPYVVLGSALGLAALIPFVTYWLAGRFVPSETSVRAWLDNQFSCGGVMSAEEYFPAAQNWENPETAVEIQNKLGRLIPFRVLKPLFICLLSTIFIACSLLIPVPAAADSARTAAYLDKDVTRIESKIELLKKENALSEQQAEEMLQTLNRLSEESDGTDPLHTFEALDALENLLNQTAQNAAQEAEKKAQTAQEAQELSKAMKNDWEQLNDAQKSAAAKELQKLLDKINGKDSSEQKSMDSDAPENAEQNADSKGENGSQQDSSGENNSENGKPSSEPGSLQPPENMNIPDVSQLTPQQLEQLENQLKEYQNNLQGMLENLKQGEFEDMEQFQIEPSDEELDTESLKQFLEDNCPDGDCEQGVQLWMQQGGLSGHGGSGHGAAPSSPLQFDDNPPEDNPDFDKFKPEKLPTHLTRQAVEQSQLKGVTLEDASKGKIDLTDELQGKVIDPNEQDGGIGRTQRVYPMHRRSVEGYFDSGIAPQGAGRP